MDYDKAADYWKQQDKNAVKADKKLIMSETEKFISSHNTCVLATGFDSNVRCTPIEYAYLNDCFWLMSEGGEKFRNLKQNKNVCLAIYDSYTGFGKLGGMQISGQAEMVEAYTEEYLALLKFKKIPESAIRKLTHPMYLIKIKPSYIEFLNSDFKKLGVSVRQQIEC